MNENKSITGPSSTPFLSKKRLSELRMEYAPECVLDRATKELEEKGVTSHSSDGKDVIFKAMTLSEFENGLLLSVSTPEFYKTFGIDLMRKIQQEYQCATPSEKATAELMALNYTRTLDIQRKITNYLNLTTISDMGVRFLGVLSKELDKPTVITWPLYRPYGRLNNPL